MDRPEPVAAARDLVTHRYPDALQAWLSGSVVLGYATDTSDLDITVLLASGNAHRESLVHEGWPVEMFVHTEATIRHFVAQDTEGRHPTMARLVSTGVSLLPGDHGRAVREECAAVVAAGPPPLSPDELEYLRYRLTDQLDDLVGLSPGPVLDAVVVGVWRQTAELLLNTARWWSGGGKWLMREVAALDAARGTSWAARLHAALHDALTGDPAPLETLADEVLEPLGGRLWAGFRRGTALG